MVQPLILPNIYYIILYTIVIGHTLYSKNRTKDYEVYSFANQTNFFGDTIDWNSKNCPGKHKQENTIMMFYDTLREDHKCGFRFSSIKDPYRSEKEFSLFM